MGFDRAVHLDAQLGLGCAGRCDQISNGRPPPVLLLRPLVLTSCPGAALSGSGSGAVVLSLALRGTAIDAAARAGDRGAMPTTMQRLLRQRIWGHCATLVGRPAASVGSSV
eukprot:SAG31_NODE_85_length_26982_cov_19.325485_7_plen_111_part_00